MWRSLAASPRAHRGSVSAAAAGQAAHSSRGAAATVAAHAGTHEAITTTTSRSYVTARRTSLLAASHAPPLPLRSSAAPRMQQRHWSSHAPFPPPPAPSRDADLSAVDSVADGSDSDSAAPPALLPSEAHLHALQSLEQSRQTLTLLSALGELAELFAHSSTVLTIDGTYAGAEQCAMLQRLDALLLSILQTIAQDGARYAGSRLTLSDYRLIFSVCEPRRTAWPEATALHPDLPPPLQRHAAPFARLLREQIDAANEEEKLQQLQSSPASSSTAGPTDPSLVSSSLQLVRLSDLQQILSRSGGGAPQVAEGLAHLFRTGSAAQNSASAAVVHLSSALAAPSSDEEDAPWALASPAKARAPPRTPHIAATPAEIARSASHVSTKAQLDALLASIGSLYNKRDLALREELHKFRAPLSQSSAFRTEARRLLQSVLDLVPLVPADQHRTFVQFAEYRRLLEVSRDFECLDLSAQLYPRILQQQELSAKMHPWRYPKLRRTWESARDQAAKDGKECPPEPSAQPPLVPFYLVEMLLNCVAAAPQTRDEYGVAQGGPEAVQRLLEHMSHRSVRPKLEQLESIPQAALIDLARASATAPAAPAEKQSRLALLKSTYAKATANAQRCSSHTHKSMFLALASTLDLSPSAEADVALLDRAFDHALSDTLNKEAVDETLLERGLLTVLERLESPATAASPALQQRLLRRADVIWTASKARSLICAPLLEGVLRCYALVGGTSSISTMLDHLADGVVSETLAASHLRLGALAPLVASPLAFGIVFRAMAAAERPEQYVKNAQELYEVMHTRHEKAAKQAAKDPRNTDAAQRAHELDPTHTLAEAYMAYTRRAWAGLPLLARWHLMGFRQKERNLSVLLQLLHSFILGGLHNHAVRLVDQYQRDGHTLRAPVLAAWVAAYIPGGHASAAEAVWQGMTEVGLQPNAEAYRALFQVYMHTREAAQVAKIEPAYATMLRSQPAAAGAAALAFTFQDLEILARTAATCGLEQQAVLWLERAEAIAPKLPAPPVDASLSKSQQKRERKALNAAARALAQLDTPLVGQAAVQSNPPAQPASLIQQKPKQATPKSMPSAAQQAARVAALLGGDEPVASTSPSSAPALRTAPVPVAAAIADPKPESAKSQIVEAPSSPTTPGSARLVPPHVRHAFHAAMKSLSGSDDGSKALDLVAAFERKGGRLTLTVILIWLALFTRQTPAACDWKAAEQVWTKMIQSGLAPTSAAYRNMAHVYMVAASSGSANLRPQLDALESDMRKSGITLELMDLQYLLKTARKLKLDSEVARWARHAQQQPELAAKLDQQSQTIMAKAGQPAAATAAIVASAEAAPASGSVPASAVTEESRSPSTTTSAVTVPRPVPAPRAPTAAASKAAQVEAAATKREQADQRRKLAARTSALLQGSPEDEAALAASRAVTMQRSSSTVSDSAAATRAQLKICFEIGDSLRAERIVREFEAAGGRCDAAIFNLWISSHLARGDWRGAEGVWHRMLTQKIEPDRVSFCTLAQVYMRDGDAAQLAKIDALISHMRQTHLNFAMSDFQRLIKSAHANSLNAEVRRWSNLARAAGLFDKLDEAARTIVDMAELQREAEEAIAPTPTAAARVKPARVLSTATTSQVASPPEPSAASESKPEQPIPAPAAPLTLPSLISPVEFSKLNQHEKSAHMRASRAAFRKELESLLSPAFNEQSLAQMDEIHAATQSAAVLDRKFLFGKGDLGPALRLCRRHLLADAARKITGWAQQAGFAEHMDEPSSKIMREIDVWAGYEKGKGQSQEKKKKQTKQESKAMESKQKPAAASASTVIAPSTRAASEATSATSAEHALQCAAPVATAPASSVSADASASTGVGASALASLPSAPGVLNFLSQLSDRTASWRAADAAAFAASDEALRTDEWRSFYEECSAALVQFRSFLDAAPYSPSRQFVSWASWVQLFGFLRDHKLTAVHAPLFAQECVKQLVDSIGRVERLARIQGKPMPSAAAQKMPAETVQSMVDALVTPVEHAIGGATSSSGANAAARLLVQLHAHSLRAHVDLRPSHFVSVLRSLGSLVVPGALDFDEALAKARAYYLSVPAAFQTAEVHRAMLEVYGRHGMEVEALALEKAVAGQHASGEGSNQALARLETIYIELQGIQQQFKSQLAPRAFTPAPTFAVDLEAAQRKRVSLLQESLSLWTQIKSSNQARGLSVEAVCTVLRILRSAGDISAQVSVIDEALALESEQSSQDLAAPQPVFVDADAYGILVDACCSARDAYEFIALARAAWSRMLIRHSEARSRKQLVRAHQLEVSSHVRQIFLRFWARTSQLSDLLAVWASFPADYKRAHPAAVIPVFNSLAFMGAPEAEVAAVVADLDAAGVAFTVQSLTAWIAVYKHSGHAAAAERVWERMQQLKIAPTHLTYSTMMQVYLTEGSADSLAKIDALYAQSQASPRTALQGADYAALLKACHALRLGDQARLWAERTSVAGQWNRLDGAARQIANRVAIWEATPRAEPLTEEQRREAQIIDDAATVIVTPPPPVAPRAEEAASPVVASSASAASEIPVTLPSVPLASKKKKKAVAAPVKVAVVPKRTRTAATSKVAMLLNGSSDEAAMQAVAPESSAPNATPSVIVTPPPPVAPRAEEAASPVVASSASAASEIPVTLPSVPLASKKKKKAVAAPVKVAVVPKRTRTAATSKVAMLLNGSSDEAAMQDAAPESSAPNATSSASKAKAADLPSPVVSARSAPSVAVFPPEPEAPAVVSPVAATPAPLSIPAPVAVGPNTPDQAFDEMASLLSRLPAPAPPLPISAAASTKPAKPKIVVPALVMAAIEDFSAPSSTAPTSVASVALQPQISQTPNDAPRSEAVNKTDDAAPTKIPRRLLPLPPQPPIKKAPARAPAKKSVIGSSSVAAAAPVAPAVSSAVARLHKIQTEALSANLSALAGSGDTVEAARLVGQWQASSCLPGQWTLPLLNAWLRVFKRSSATSCAAGAEQVWALFAQSGVQPSARSYRHFMLSLMRAASAEADGRIDTLLLSMGSATPPVHFVANDYSKLILGARALDRPELIEKWKQLAEQRGWSAQLNTAALRVLQVHAAEKDASPAASSSAVADAPAASSGGLSWFARLFSGGSSSAPVTATAAPSVVDSAAAATPVAPIAATTAAATAPAASNAASPLDSLGSKIDGRVSSASCAASSSAPSSSSSKPARRRAFTIVHEEADEANPASMARVATILSSPAPPKRSTRPRAFTSSPQQPLSAKPKQKRAQVRQMHTMVERQQRKPLSLWMQLRLWAGMRD